MISKIAPAKTEPNIGSKTLGSIAFAKGNASGITIAIVPPQDVPVAKEMIIRNNKHQRW